MKADFINQSDNIFTDISSEMWREYSFANKDRIYTHEGYSDLVRFRIYLPKKLSVSESGGHRIFDDSGRCHYIPAGWVHIEWEVFSGSPHFVK